jgi:hypothetical protein
MGSMKSNNVCILIDNKCAAANKYRSSFTLNSNIASTLSVSIAIFTASKIATATAQK